MCEVLIARVFSYTRPSFSSLLCSFNSSDVNECDDHPNYCQVGGQCVNTPGSYRCLCKQGYEVGNGGSHCIGKGLATISSICPSVYLVVFTTDRS